MDQSGFDIKETKEGGFILQPKDFRLHVNTGDESDQVWPDVQEDEEIMPLLDLPQSWEDIIHEKPLPAKKTSGESIVMQNAFVMIKELKYHLLASTAHPSNVVHPKGKSAQQSEGPSGCEGSEKKEVSEEGCRGPEESDGTATELKSIYGASVLLKLQWEDKTKQKAVPHRTFEEMALFISDITSKLKEVFGKNETAGQALVDVFALELTVLILARYMEGIETGEDVLEEACFSLLTFCAERANPKEMHMSLRLFIRKVNPVYMEATAYLILQPLMTLWAKLILRMKSTRHSFLYDFLHSFDKMVPCARSFETMNVYGSAKGIEKPGRIKNLTEILLQFLEDLTKIQIQQRETSDCIRLSVDTLGREIPKLEKTLCESDSEERKGRNTDSGTSIDESERATELQSRIEKETKDWVKERAVTLARALQILESLWEDVRPPRGEERSVPKKKKKSKEGENRSTEDIAADYAENGICRCFNLFRGLGWSNPVLVCQIAANGLSLESSSKAQDLLQKHIGYDVRSKKERRETLFSLTGVGEFVCGALRPKTLAILSDRNEEFDEYAIDLSGTGFDLLDGNYAFDIVLPFIMTLIAKSHVSPILAGVTTIKAFLERIPGKKFATFEDAIRLRCGISAAGKPVNVVGLAHNLANAVDKCDDPKHRRVAHETLQTVLDMCEDPYARYVIAESVFHDCKRVALAAQLVTEMKDAVRYSDLVAAEGKYSGWTSGKACDLRTRFAQVCFPRYFTPRKELLMSINAMVSTAGACLFLAVSDKKALMEIEEGNKLRLEIEKRRRFTKSYCKLGRECIRALASVAEHDRKNVPNSQMAKVALPQAQALFAASGRTLNHCIAALSMLDVAVDALEG